MIKNPVYCGKIAWNKRKSYSNSAWRNTKDWILIQSKYIPRIISDDTFEISQEVLHKKVMISNKRYYSSDFILKGLVFCCCGEALLTKNQETESTLADGSKRKYGKQIYYCPAKCISVTKGDIESLIKRDLVEMINQSDKGGDFLVQKLSRDIEVLELEKKEIYERVNLCTQKETELSSQVSCLARDDNLDKNQKDIALNCFLELCEHNKLELETLKQREKLIDKKVKCRKVMLRKKYYYANKLIATVPKVIDDLSNERLKTILEHFYEKLTLNGREVSIDYSIPAKCKIIYL